MGTALYQAPELLRKQPHDSSVDWWACGCLLLEMVRGEPPFQRDDDEEITQAVLAHAGEGSVPTPHAGALSTTSAVESASPTGATDATTAAAAAAAATPTAATATAAAPSTTTTLAPASATNPHLQFFVASGAVPSAANPHLQLRRRSPTTVRPCAPPPAAPPPTAPPFVAPPPVAPARSTESAAFLQLCGQLLEPDAKRRLGSAATGGAASVQQHPWFDAVDWDDCLAMTPPAPFVPPPLPEADTDAMLLELGRRCQQGFD